MAHAMNAYAEARRWAEEEHYHYMEQEGPAPWCPYERPTGDKRWPVLCDKDNRYATRAQCDECARRRQEAER